MENVFQHKELFEKMSSFLERERVTKEEFLASDKHIF